MSTTSVWALWLSAIIIYGTGAGYTARDILSNDLTLDQVEAACSGLSQEQVFVPATNRTGDYWYRTSEYDQCVKDKSPSADAGLGAFVGGALWPIVLPIRLGMDLHQQGCSP